MALQSLNFWEVAIDATQIGLCGLILLFLIRNHIKFKQMNLNAPFEKKSQNFNTEFVIEAIRQQTELAFNHISEAIDKERQTLHAYFELRETQLAPGLLTSAESDRIEPCFSSEPSKTDAAFAIYSEIENLAHRGLSPTDISEKLHVPRGEVDLILKLKNLRAETVKQRDLYGSS